MVLRFRKEILFILQYNSIKIKKKYEKIIKLKILRNLNVNATLSYFRMGYLAAFCKLRFEYSLLLDNEVDFISD